MKAISAYQITAFNDDYHGGVINFDIFQSKKEAEKEVAYLKANTTPCRNCNHVPHYSINKVTVFLQEES